MNRLPTNRKLENYNKKSVVPVNQFFNYFIFSMNFLNIHECKLSCIYEYILFFFIKKKKKAKYAIVTLELPVILISI